MATAPTTFEGIRWGRLTAGMGITTIVGLSVHAVMLQWLHVPYPDTAFRSVAAQLANHAAMLWAAAWLYSCLRGRFSTRPAPFSLFVLFLLLFSANETLRSAFMNGYCLTGSLLGRTVTGLLSTAPRVLTFGVVAGLAAGISCFRNDRMRLSAGILAVVFLVFVVAPASAALEATIRERASHWMPLVGWCRLPYGMNVLIPAYATFLEPVFASFACIALVWRVLPRQALRQIAAFALLILALKKQLLMSFFYAAFGPGPFLTALASMGQFSLEAAALGVLTALSWRWARGDGAMLSENR
jgi:hypothetical protein